MAKSESVPMVADEDERWMRVALELAERAAMVGEVPVGAVVVSEGAVLGEGHNRPIAAHDPTAHAEIVAIRAASGATENYRLPNASLYVTLEPCAMCAGAIVQARVARVVFGAHDPRAGAVESVFSIFDEDALNHRVAWRGGVLAQAAGQVLREFFRSRR